MKFPVKKLLEVVQKNRDTHRSTFEKAMESYRKLAIAELERGIDDAKAGRKIMRGLSLVEPMDQTKDYDRVLSMLNMTSDENIELDEQKYAQYILDQWSWKAQFDATNSRYLGQ